jgi:uncharacterized membrane protein YagU involved in acid resistance
MLYRLRAFAYMQSWRWALVWGLLMTVLIALLTDAALWQALLYGAAFFLTVGLIRSRQGRRRRDRA